MNNILLDTHILVWLMNDDPTLTEKEKNLIRNTTKNNLLIISAISIWEISLLVSKGKIVINQEIYQWTNSLLSLPYMRLIPIDANIAIQSCNLPGLIHTDPADRMIIATSRILDIPILTRDKEILKYATQNFIKVC